MTTGATAAGFIKSATIAAMGLLMTVAAASAQTAADTAAAPQPRQPVLKIGGKADPDVYLQSLDIQVDVAGSLASTRYTMVFRNRTGRTLEGVLTFPLPDGGTVTHYALDINGRMRDAVPVEKARATQVFEEIRRRQIDPGLLEKVEGNNYRTRIYPFSPNQSRTVSVGYEEELRLEDGRLRYILPMAFVDSIESFSIGAIVRQSDQRPFVHGADSGFGGAMRFERAGKDYVASFSQKNCAPSRAFEFSLPAPVDAPRVITQSAGGEVYFLASVTAAAETRAKRWRNDLAIIWDVSLSGSQRNLRRDLEALDVIFAEKRNASVHLYFLNNRLKRIVNRDRNSGAFTVYDGKWGSLRKVLESAVFDGGTDYSQIDLSDIKGNEILFFSDGISTLSDAGILMRDAELKNFRPIHTFVSSLAADYGVMKLISGKTAGKFVDLNALSFARLREELLTETLQFLGAAHESGVREVYPTIATPVRGNFSISGIIDSGNTELTLLFGNGHRVERRVRVMLRNAECGMRNAERKSKPRPAANNDVDVHSAFRISHSALNISHRVERRVRVMLRNAECGMRNAERKSKPRPAANNDVDVHSALRTPHSALNISRIWARKKIAELDLRYAANRAEIARLGKEFGVVTRNTSLIVLELVSDYVRFDIEPPATEPGLLAEFRSIKRANGARLRDTEREMLESAAWTADRMETWWNYPYDVWSEARPTVEVRPARTGDPGNISGDIEGVNWRLSGGTIVSSTTESRGFGAGSGSWGELIGEVFQDIFSGPPGSTFRTRESVLNVIDRNMPALRRAADWRSCVRLGGEPLRGTVTVKFAVNHFGRVVFAELERPTIDDFELAMFILGSVRCWNFGEIDRPGDYAEITHRFTFDGKRPTACGRVRPEFPCSVDPRHRAADSAAWVKHNAESHIYYRDAAAIYDAERRARDSTIWATLIASDSTVVAASRPAYLKQLTGDLAADYQTYLRLRNDHSASSAFYFDMSGWFRERGDHETALRVLTSIADLELENAANYRLLGYRLKEYGEYALQKHVCGKVLEWRPMEPQSLRDYALALADNGERQAALDSLYGMLTKAYSTDVSFRSEGIEEVVIMEINRLVAENRKLLIRRADVLNISGIDRRLIRHLPVDLRVVLNWNLSDANVDLCVVGPDHEATHTLYVPYAEPCGDYLCRGCYRFNRHQINDRRGRASADITGGYGPEQFMQRNAAKGAYAVYARYVSRREFASTEPATVMVEIYTKYAGHEERRRVVTLQLPKPAENKFDGIVKVGEFTVQ